MGKGARKRQMSEQNRLEKERQRQAAAAKRKKNILIGLLCGVVAVLAVVALVIGNLLTAAGWFLRRTISVTSESYRIDNAMMSYYIHTQYENYVQNNSSLLETMGLDTTKKLKSQEYAAGETWLEYFIKRAESQVQALVIMAEGAKADSISLDTTDQAEIQALIDDLKSTAEQSGMAYDEYLAELYGVGVKEDDVRRCLELSALATKYYNHLMDSFTYTDEEIDNFYNENKNGFLYASYKSFILKSTIPTGATEEEIANINAETKKKADELKACTTPEAFDAWLTAYMKADPETSSYSDERIAEKVAEALTEDYAYSDSSDFSKWLFSDERKVGDTYIIEATNQYTVYMVTSPAARKDYMTKNVRHILFSTSTYGSTDGAKAKAEEILVQWKEQGSTQDAFIELAEKYSDDTGSVKNGGLYENVPKGEMVENFENWIYAEGRKAGDAEIVETSYGYHVMYFVGDGLPAWKAEAIDQMKEASYSDRSDELAEKYPVTFDYRKLNQINA